MKIYFLGAVGDVTGSAYHVKTRRASVLVDCGMFQGDRKCEAKNRAAPRVPIGSLDAVVLTHGHLDHTGRLPLLTKKGYKGPIYATKPTIEMATLILKDAAKIQLGDLERVNRKRERAGQPPLEPLYVPEDVAALKPLTRQVAYETPVEIAPGVSIKLRDAGHMLGSASIEMTVDDDGKKKVVVFSGDLGPRGAPMLQDPTPFEHADVVILESTYGDRDHRPLAESLAQGREILKKAVAARGKILVPVFAIGRSQLLLYCVAAAFRNKVVPPFPVFLDSPMAIEATKVYQNNTELFDQEALKLMKSGQLRADLKTAKFSQTADDSRALNHVRGPCMILAGAGMCNAGRILHHLKHNLPFKETVVLIVGYQSPGSLGRLLLDGVKSVKIHGETIKVKATVHNLSGFSAHAGQKDLLHWFSAIAGCKPRVILTHGEDKARTMLSGLIKSKFGLNSEIPQLNDVIEF